MVFAPHPQHRRVVFVLIDGARHDVLRALLAQGDLPNLARWVIEPGGMTVGTTVFPSTTGVAYIPFLFGRYPGTADVPGIRWLDRALGEFVARARTAGELPALFVAADHGVSVVGEHCDIALALEAWGVPTIRHPWHVWRRGAQAAVMVSGNGCAHVYFRPRGGPPTPRSGAAVPSDLVEQLLGLPAVQLGAWRGGHGDVVLASGWPRACVGGDGRRLR